MYCTNCGTKMADDSIFCTVCGTGVRKPNSTPESERQLPPRETTPGLNVYPGARDDFPPSRTEHADEPVIAVSDSESGSDAEPISQFPEISDGFPDPTRDGMMSVAANATDTDRITVQSPSTEPPAEPHYQNYPQGGIQNQQDNQFRNFTPGATQPMPGQVQSPAYSYVGGEHSAAQPVGFKTAKTAGEDEKPFFGKGAFTLCLVVIALLSIACGVLAGLYFNM